MNIIQNRMKFLAVSFIVILAGIVAMVVNGAAGRGALNFDIEFTGGTSMSINIGQEFENEDIRVIIEDITGQKAPQIQKILGKEEVSIKMQSVEGETRTEIIKALQEKYGFSDEDVLSVADISGTVSGEMQRAALIAVAIACIAMLIYISIRFKDFRMGGSAIIALLHDVLVVVAFYALFRVPINNSFIAAVLTVLGYSINATIVIFDRIRENKTKFKRHEKDKLIDKSVNQTLSRSINTSLTTLFTIGAIYVLGVPSIKEFALPLIIGIISGAYSSIFISGSVWYILLPKNEK